MRITVSTSFLWAYFSIHNTSFIFISTLKGSVKGLSGYDGLNCMGPGETKRSSCSHFSFSFPFSQLFCGSAGSYGRNAGSCDSDGSGQLCGLATTSWPCMILQRTALLSAQAAPTGHETFILCAAFRSRWRFRPQFSQRSLDPMPTADKEAFIIEAWAKKSAVRNSG